ncbi:hypothetical protein BJY01DRAFT_225865 [Aspergillus pseudoustus]|uniref:Uncharacterized protein n=1 Tax=Aspergillus pseudoustus TaxID=1810923 RepID=A0ABR4IY17_9EURO
MPFSVNLNQADEYIDRWTKNITDILDELYALEPKVGTAAEQSATQALAAITDGLGGLNKLLDFWPDYKGDDATNAQRLEIIQAASDLVAKGATTVKDTEDDTSVHDRVFFFFPPKIIAWMQIPS